MDSSIKKTDDSEQATTLLHSVTTAKQCKVLIMEGISVNARDAEGRTPLHYAILHRRGLEIVRQLLKSGANVNACDKYKCTPLIAAIQLMGKDVLEIVRELLQHGANPNVHDFQGYSALTLAVYKKDLNVIKEMLNWGADVNFRDKTPIHWIFTPLTEAINQDEDCAKLFIKMTVIKYFDNDYKKIINLDRFKDVSNYIFFLEECASEVLQMQSFNINNKYSLFELIVNGRKCFEPLYWKDDDVAKIPSVYPIYHDVILTNIQPHLLRAQLLRQLRGLQEHGGMFIKNNNNDCKGKNIYLNADCLFKIAEYLTNDELSAFIDALLT